MLMEENIIVKDGFWLFDDVLINYDGPEENVLIPVGIVELDDPFSNYNKPSVGATDVDKIKTVTLPKSVKKIHPKTFTRLPNLEAILVDKENKFFLSENGVLFNKRKTELISFPQKSHFAIYSVPPSTKRIAVRAFYDCKKLEKLSLPLGISRINPETFYNCDSLIDISIPETLTSIGKYAFYNCKSLNVIKLSGNVTQIGVNAFTKLNFDVDRKGPFVTANTKGFAIECPKDSFAEQYAKEHKIECIYP